MKKIQKWGGIGLAALLVTAIVGTWAGNHSLPGIMPGLLSRESK